MSLIKDITRDTQQVLRSGRVLRDEDTYRTLAKNERTGFRLPIIYANNAFVLSSAAAWTGFRVASKPWGFLDKNARLQYFRSSNSIFHRIFPSEKESGGHLLVTNRVYTADDWERGLLAKYEDTAGPHFERYVQDSRGVIERREFFEREVYLFSKLGLRGKQGGVRGAARDLVEFLALGAGLDDSQPDAAEKNYWREQATGMMDTLGSSWLACEPIHRRRVEYLTRHLDTPGLPTPEVAPADDQEWSAGYWRTVLASYTREIDLGVVGKNRYRCVQFEAPTGEGTSYAAYLPLAHIPNRIHGEQNWVHHAAGLPFPVDLSLRFEIIDPDRAERDLEKPIEAAEAQEVEDAEAGVRGEDLTGIQKEGLREAKTRSAMNREPMAYWQAVFCVYDSDKEELLSKVARLIKHYKDLQFELVCPRNDQRELFYQAFPGSDVLVGDWVHRTDTEYLAAAQPWLTSSVGDKDDDQGLYQGHTIVRDANGIPHKGVPVFYDLQNVVDTEGKAPTEAVCGMPGSGKTVSRGLKIVHEDALRGITQFVWDPKGDFLPLAVYAARMRMDPAKVKLVDLYDSRTSVSLDAIAVAEVDEEAGIDERESSAVEVLTSLCQDYVNNVGDGLVYQSILQQAVSNVLAAEVAGGPTAKMTTVLEQITRWRKHDFAGLDVGEARQEHWADCCRMLDEHLRRVAKDTLGRLLFRDPDAAGTIKIAPGDLIIFIAINLPTTEPGENPTPKSMVADVISGLMTDFIRSMLYRLDDTVPKALVFDEWHVIKRTSRAQSLVGWLRRMGRSKRCMVRQLSQSAGDFESGSLSTIWCGYVDDEDEARASCALLGIEPTPTNFSMLMNLGKGQFLFRDAQKPARVAHVQVDIWDDWLFERFRTDATSKSEMLAAATKARALPA